MYIIEMIKHAVFIIELINTLIIICSYTKIKLHNKYVNKQY